MVASRLELARGQTLGGKESAARAGHHPIGLDMTWHPSSSRDPGGSRACPPRPLSADLSWNWRAPASDLACTRLAGAEGKREVKYGRDLVF
jgi:hypothetical protein